MAGSGSPEVNDDPLFFVDVQVQVVLLTPVHQISHLPVSKFIVILNEAHNCCVIHVLQDLVVVVPWTAVVGHQGEQQGAWNTALGCAGVQGDDLGVIVVDSDRTVLSEQEV